MYIQHEIPLLEYDPDPGAILTPTHEQLDLRLPERCVFAFPGRELYRYAETHGGTVIGHYDSATKDFPVYLLHHKGHRVALCQAPVGAAPAAQLMDWLIGYGARKILSTGSCGVLRALDEGLFLIPQRALRDEGCSYHYLPPARYAETDPRAREALAAVLAERGIPCREVVTWTTDGVFRETQKKVQSRRDEGCEVVEMECAALAACAAFRKVLWGELLFTADTLADPDRYDPRGFGKSAVGIALELCLDAVILL